MNRVKPLWQFIRHEMQHYPGRQLIAAKFVITCSLIIVISMTLQIPLVALSIIMVFFCFKENAMLTRLAALMMITGTVLGLLTSLVFLKWTFDDPMLRFISASCLIFIGIYFIRISKFGPLGLTLAIVVSFSQSLADTVAADPETMVRGLLWAFIATFYPAVLVLLVNWSFWPLYPRQALVQTHQQAIAVMIEYLDSYYNHDYARPIAVDKLSALILKMRKQLAFVKLDRSVSQADKASFIKLTDTLEQALSLLTYVQFNADQQLILLTIRKQCTHLKQALSQQRFYLPAIPLKGLEPYSVAYQFVATLNGFASATEPSLQQRKEDFLVADAFTNLSYWRFGLKGSLATMLCYLIYTSIDWPGIHTAMLTCIILSLPSTGAINHKGILRLLGSIIGGVIALLCTVVVIPHLDSIVGLLLLSLPVIALGAWIASGSEKINYIGVQIVFTYALSLFSQFSPSFELTEVRDRFIGVLLGVGISTLIYSVLWPERDSDKLEQTLKAFFSHLSKIPNFQIQAGEDNWLNQGWGWLEKIWQQYHFSRLELNINLQEARKALLSQCSSHNLTELFIAMNRLRLMDKQTASSHFLSQVMAYFAICAEKSIAVKEAQQHYQLVVDSYTQIEDSQYTDCASIIYHFIVQLHAKIMQLKLVEASQ